MDNSKISMKEVNHSSDNDYNSLAKLAFRNPFNKEIVFSFFKAYESLSEHVRDHQQKYYQLQYFQKENKWEPLKKLGLCYLDDNKKTQAYFCLLESLRLNPGQTDIYKHIAKLKNSARINYPKSLRKNKCTVSVIIPTYNRMGKIKETVQSALAQSFQDFELIIVNNNQSDAVKNIVDSFNSPKIKYYHLRIDEGQYASINEGILRAEGKYICHLDDDDLYYPDHLKTLVEAMEQNNFDFAYSNTQGIEGKVENGKFMPERICFIWNQKFSKHELVKHPLMAPVAIIYKKKIVKEVGLFREETRMSEDWDFHLRCAEKYKLNHVDKITTEYRQKEDNQTKLNRVGCFFSGKIMPRYFLFHKGKVALTKYYLFKENREKAFELYKNIRENYMDGFKGPLLSEDLIELAVSFNDRRFLVQLAKEYFRLDAKKCMNAIKKYRSAGMFCAVIPLLPLRTIKSIKGRIMNGLNRIIGLTKSNIMNLAQFKKT